MSVDALFTANSSQLPGTNFLTNGANQGAYGAGASMLAGSPDPASIPALGILSNSSTCGGDLGTAAHQNFDAVCANTGTLTLKFSQAVTDPTLDITGIGGTALAHQEQQGGYQYARGSFNNTRWNILTPGIAFSQLTAGATNLQISNGGTRLQENNRNGNGFCNNNATTNPGTKYQSPSMDYAGCGSVTLQGTFSEVTFQIDAQATPWSMFPAAQYGTGSELFQNDGTQYADGINGLNAVNSEKVLLPQNLTTSTNSDLQRISLRLPQTGSLGDRVWRDTNGDGIQSDGEPGVQGVTVQLLDGDANPVKDANGNPITTTTDANGNYKFTDLPFGAYKVTFTDLPADTAFTKANAGSDDAVDSDADPATGVTDAVTLTSTAPENLTLDAGIVPVGSLGDKVWRDTNGDGIQDPNEPGVADVKVELLDKDGNPVKDADGNPITTTTDANGNYKFSNLSLGDYKVKFDLPENTAFTKANAGSDDAVDSDADPVTGVSDVVSLTLENPSNMTVDAGIVRLGSLGDKVWRDDNGDGIQDPNEPGVAGVKVELLDKDGNPVKDANGNPITTTTDANGNYKFSNLPLGDYKVKFDLPPDSKFTTANAGSDDAADSDADQTTGVTDVVSLTDSAPDNMTVDAGIVPVGSLGDKVWRDDNGDGIQDPNEPGISGVKVELLDKDGNPVKDANGNPVTTTTDANGNYLFTDLPMGDYKVKVDLPAGTKATTAGAGDDRGKDSNIDANGVSDVVSLTPENPNRRDVDAGVVPLGSLGDKVWRDDNGDGIQDPNEPGVSGVKVELLDKDGNPVKDANGDPITTVTDKDGNYLFTDLPMGDYKVKVDLPAGTKATTAGAGSDRGKDSNIDPSGVSDTVSLTPENPNRRDVDAGIVPLGSLGDKVWRDDNGDGVQGDNEPGISGVKVELLDKDGNPVKDANGNPITTTTDKDGNYKFSNLPLGDYKVKFDLPPDSKFTTKGAGSDQAKDSNPDAATGVTDVVSLTADAPDNMTVDAGIVPVGSLGDKVWRDDNGDGIQDPNEPGISGVKVELLDKDGNPVKDANGNPITTTTDANGNYLFTDLPMGDYKVKVDLPAGTKATTAGAGDDRGKDSNIDANGVSDVVSLTPENPNRRDIDGGIVILPAAKDDQSLNNKQGTVVTVPALKNDKGDLDPSTVKITDKDGKPVSSLVVPGEGTWTVDPNTGDITFAPEKGFTGNPTPVNYTVKDLNGNETGAKVTITYVQPIPPSASDDQSLDNKPGSTVKVPVLGNDKGNLVPSSVKIIDPGTGNPVDKLVVPGEGSWTVDPQTGDITFTPEKGFEGNPTPIQYLVKDVDGNEVRAKVTVTYSATEPGQPGNPAGPGAPENPGGDLAYTGANIGSGVIALGALLFLGGAGLLIIRRRRQH
ncbi:SdrD B-like domain-containing protein [Arthrobacter woluwensis]|uniref:SdrD B-like domain-containing protein n=1 Tax=Arthrobacter woluwensis TaxID=156980 RepID=UPI0014700183|nr:SdrD B-like domain-containing protein [Arthrobacter woluwensis]